MRVLGGLQYGVSLAALVGAIAGLGNEAHAGAFAVREQSAYFQGMSFAGDAAGEALSSMFWNSAAAAAAPGMNSESHVALVVPQTEITATGGLLTGGSCGTAFSNCESGDIGDPTVVPSSYANYQVNERMFLGLAINGQYGFTTKPDNLDFAGTPIATTSHIFSINFNPTVAYKLTPQLTIGVGAQVLYADVRLRSSDPAGSALLPDGREVDGTDWAFGATAGVIWQPAPGTSLGVGYRSSIDVSTDGTCTGAGLSTIITPGVTCGAGKHVTADLTLPDMVTASFRQRLDQRFTLLGTVEWTNWSTVGKQAEFKSGGVTTDVFPLGYDDGWFFSAGLEYKWTPNTTVRGGLGYEISPISDEVRNVSLPDNDRVWLSVGATTKLTERASIDLAYTHLFVKDAPIRTASATLGTLLEAEATGDIDVLAASFKYKWGAAEPELEPLK